MLLGIWRRGTRLDWSGVRLAIGHSSSRPGERVPSGGVLTPVEVLRRRVRHQTIGYESRASDYLAGSGR